MKEVDHNNPLTQASVEAKIKALEGLKDQSFEAISRYTVPKRTSRDIEVRKACDLPKKKGLSFLSGKKRLLHDLASIELQAAELCVRTLIEFYNSKDIPLSFFKELKSIALDETRHFKASLEVLKEYGGHWGEFPVHLGLWNVSLIEDEITERLLKVHRYLEGSGLDASSSLLNRVHTVPDSKPIAELLKMISEEEVGHVQFGSRWFAYFCKEKGVTRIGECKRILEESGTLLPRRRERISVSLREKAGFLKEEIELFKDHQKAVLID